MRKETQVRISHHLVLVLLLPSKISNRGCTFMSCILSLATELASSHQSSPSSSLLSGPSSVEEDIDKLKSMLRMVQAVLNDAEEREGYETSLKLWLKELKGVAYNAEDLLKEYEYKVLPDLLGNRALAAASETSYGRKQEEEQVCDLTATLLQLFSKRVIKLRERGLGALHLREGDETRLPHLSLNPQSTSSYVNASAIFGRKDEKGRVIEILISDAFGRFFVISMVGMGGIGNTSLAQLVYNDRRVQQNFNVRSWICVGEI